MGAAVALFFEATHMDPCEIIINVKIFVGSNTILYLSFDIYFCPYSPLAHPIERERYGSKYVHNGTFMVCVHGNPTHSIIPSC